MYMLRVLVVASLCPYSTLFRSPGAFVQLTGNRAGSSNEIVFVALAQDQATYEGLAANPAQDAWYRRFIELIDGDVTWEDRSEEHTSELQSPCNIVCRHLLENKK